MIIVFNIVGLFWQMIQARIRFSNAYITKLDEEIFSDLPEIPPDAQDGWQLDQLSTMCVQLLDKARNHGWACVQFYKGVPLWRVFSERDRTKWIYDKKIFKKML